MKAWRSPLCFQRNGVVAAAVAVAELMASTSQLICLGMLSKAETRPKGWATGASHARRLGGDGDQPVLAGLGLGGGHADEPGRQIDLRPVEALNLFVAESGKGGDGEPREDFRAGVVEDEAEFIDGEGFNLAVNGLGLGDAGKVIEESRLMYLRDMANLKRERMWRRWLSQVRGSTSRWWR